MALDEAEIATLLDKEGEHLDRGEVIKLVEAGVWGPDDAEKWARDNSDRPFAREPELACFDPLKEKYWSIQMTVAWIMGRNAEAVRLCWQAYLHKCYEWLPGPLSLPEHFEQGRRFYLIHPSPYIFNKYAINREMGSTEAILELRRKLESGAVEGSGITKDGVRRAILPLEWCDLSFSIKSWWDDEDLAANGVVKLQGDKDLFAHNKEDEFELRRVQFDSSQVLAEFPTNGEFGVRRPSLSGDQVKAILVREMQRRGGFIDQAAAAEYVRAIDPTFKRDLVREIVKSLTGNTKRGPRGKRNKSADEKGEKS